MSDNNDKTHPKIFDLRPNATPQRLASVHAANALAGVRKKAAAESAKIPMEDPATALVTRAAKGDASAVTDMICLFGAAETRRRINAFKTKQKNEKKKHENRS